MALASGFPSTSSGGVGLTGNPLSPVINGTVPDTPTTPTAPMSGLMPSVPSIAAGSSTTPSASPAAATPTTPAPTSAGMGLTGNPLSPVISGNAPTNNVNPGSITSPMAPSIPSVSPSIPSVLPSLPGVPSNPAFPTAPVTPTTPAAPTNPINPGFSLQSLLPNNVPANASTPDASNYTAAEAPQLAGATNWNVTAPQTVAGQYANLMSAGNPAIQAAEQSAIRANASNGGNNSLMAQTAATMAGSQVALTIASADAQTNAAAAQFNATAANTFATAQNTFIQNATLSQQNFQQGVAMLTDQTNQSMQQLYAQVQANTVESGVSLQSQLAVIQANTQATLTTMAQTFADTTSTNATQEGYAITNAGITEGYTQQNATQQYGMNVQMSYLSAVQTDQTNLMQTIASIQSNPNINATQANAAIQQAVDQFNSFMTMNNAYYSSMMPTPTASNPASYTGNFPTD